MSETLAQLIDLIGVEAARALVARLGGVSHYIPMHARADHHIAQIIGEQNWQALCAHLGGTRLLLPVPERAPKRKAIMQHLREGRLSVREIALRVGTTERYVSQLRGAMQADRQQPSLFDCLTAEGRGRQ